MQLLHYPASQQRSLPVLPCSLSHASSCNPRDGCKPHLSAHRCQMWLARACIYPPPPHSPPPPLLKAHTALLSGPVFSQWSLGKQIQTRCDFHRSALLPRREAAYLRQSHDFTGSQNGPRGSPGRERERGSEWARVRVRARERERERERLGTGRIVWVEKKKKKKGKWIAGREDWSSRLEMNGNQSGTSEEEACMWDSLMLHSAQLLQKSLCCCCCCYSLWTFYWSSRDRWFQLLRKGDPATAGGWLSCVFARSGETEPGRGRRFLFLFFLSFFISFALSRRAQ